MSYKLIVHDNLKEFNKICTDLMADGYLPTGGINITMDSNYTRYYAQAFTKSTRYTSHFIG